MKINMKKLLPEANSGRVTDRGGGRLGETDKPMNKKRIARPTRGMSWHHTAKSTGLLVEVNATVVPGRNAFLPGEIPRRKCRGKSAEAIVVSREPGAGKCPLKHAHRKTRSA